jgi:hypothetical protein
MSDLTFIEKTKLEKLFQMGGGYVLDFSNRTLSEFVAESTGRDIYDAKYEYASGSKANRVRNDESLAHDNPTLNYDESLLIFNHVCSAVRFVRALEARAESAGTAAPCQEAIDDEIPF